MSVLSREQETAYQYFNRILGPDRRVIIGSEARKGTVGITAYPQVSDSDRIAGINYQSMNVSRIDKGTDSLTIITLPSGLYPELRHMYHAAILEPDGKIMWRRTKAMDMIEVTGRKAELVGEVLVRCAQALTA